MSSTLAPTQDDKEAAERYDRYSRFDPFPDLPAALLNSSDIYTYIAIAGMVCPFVEDQLKSASYAIQIGDEAIYWDDRGRLVQKHLRAGESFTVPANSIVYIKSKEKFRLPNYMAMRFNLKINNVHRGILLGTGPMVDPGFVGHLLIPLHNLTLNPYTFQESETFVWVEFTKTSPHASWDFGSKRETAYLLPDKLKLFPDSKKDRTIWEYLNEAHKGPIRSSIPDAIASAQNAAQSARRQVRRARRRSDIIGGAAILAMIGVVSTAFWNYVSAVSPQFVEINKNLGTFGKAQENDEKAFSQLRDQIVDIKKVMGDQSLDKYANKISDLERKLIELEAKVQNLPSSQNLQRPPEPAHP